jgi:hypothetical protein
LNIAGVSDEKGQAGYAKVTFRGAEVTIDRTFSFTFALSFQESYG